MDSKRINTARLVLPSDGETGSSGRSPAELRPGLNWGRASPGISMHDGDAGPMETSAREERISAPRARLIPAGPLCRDAVAARSAIHQQQQRVGHRQGRHLHSAPTPAAPSHQIVLASCVLAGAELLASGRSIDALDALIIVIYISYSHLYLPLLLQTPLFPFPPCLFVRPSSPAFSSSAALPAPSVQFLVYPVIDHTNRSVAPLPGRFAHASTSTSSSAFPRSAYTFSSFLF